MAKLVWDKTGDRLYETGVDRGVLYPISAEGTYPKGVAWNGLTAVSESPSGAEANPFYADNIKYLNLMSAEDFGGTIEAYTYPTEFGECNGEVSLAKGAYIAQQTRKTFGLSYRTIIGNDIVGNEYGYKLHLVYGALAAPSERANNTINESPEPMTMSWEFSTTPVNVAGFKPTAHLFINSTEIEAAKLTALETILYGNTETEARLPLPDEVARIVSAAG